MAKHGSSADPLTQGSSARRESTDGAAPYAKLRPGPGRPRQKVHRHQQARLRAAMVELAGSNGYRAVTVRELVALAGVSTATFYKHFSKLEDCFVSTYDAWTARVLGRAKASQFAGGREHGLARALGSLLDDFVSNPSEANLVLFEAYGVGPVARSHTSRMADALARLIGEALNGAGERSSIWRLEVGVAAAVTRLARTLIGGSRGRNPRRFADALADWAGLTASRAEIPSLCGSPVGGAAREGARERDPLLRRLEGATDDRSRLRAAAARLSTAVDASELTASQICAQANVSRSTFHRNFADPTECLLDLSGEIFSETAARARRAGASHTDRHTRTRSMLEAICQNIDLNPSLARLCWVQVPGLGRDGLRETDRLISLAGGTLSPIARQGNSDRLMTEAVLAALWAILQSCIEEHRLSELARLSPALGDLLVTAN